MVFSQGIQNRYTIGSAKSNMGLSCYPGDVDVKSKRKNIRSYIALLGFSFFLLSLCGCATYNPVTIDEVPFKQHSQTKVDGNVRVTAAVLTNQEGEQIFGVDLALKWVQAVWVEVENKDNHIYWLLSSALDPDYYAPTEIAYNSHQWLSPGVNDRIDDRFRQLAFRNPITPGSVVSGFFFVNLDQDDKEVDIDLISREQTKFFTFFFQIEALRTTSMFDIEMQHSQEDVVDVDEMELRRALEDLPCCTTSQDARENGDPLNLVLIGNANQLMPAFVRRGWHRAEDTYWGSIWKTLGSFLFGKRYRYSPVSDLYLFGRKQDVALQKARGTIHQRNHLRLWLTPIRFQNKEVWVGSISRDIGVHFTSKPGHFVTHKIDEDIDEVRNSFGEDMLFSQGLLKIGWAKGMPAVSPEEPNSNLGGDPYFTDGLLLVLVFDRRPISTLEVQFFEWEKPVGRHM